MRPLLRREPKLPFNEGARLLWLALEEKGLTQTEAEVALAVDGSGKVNRLLYAERKPGLELAIKLQKLFGIPLESWNAEPAAPFTVPGARPDVDVPIPYVVTPRSGTEG